MEKNYFASIEFSSLSIKILILSYFQNKYNVIASTSIDSSGFYNGEITDIDAFNASLDKAIEEIKLKFKINLDEIILVLPSNEHRVYSAYLNNKVLTERQIIGKPQVDSLRKQLRSAKVNDGEILVSEIPTLYTLDNNRQLRSAPIGQRSSILAIKSNIHTLPKNIVNPLITALTNRNIKVIDKVINCQCGVRATLTDYDLEKECIHVNISEDITTISVFYKNVLYKSKVLNFGLESLVLYLANNLKISKEYALNLINSYFVCDIDKANDFIFDVEQNLSEKRISGILLNRLFNAFNEILDACNELSAEFNFSEEHFILITGYFNDFPYFIDELAKYSSLNIKEGVVSLIGLKDQSFINTYGAIVDFIYNNPEYINTKIDEDEQIEFDNSNVYNSIKNDNNSTSKFVDIFED